VEPAVRELAQQVVNGLAAGSIYALIAVGYNLVYGLLEFMNFAHGHVYMFGTFVVASLMLAGVPFPVAVLGGMLTGALVGLAVERFAYRPLRSAHRIVPTVSAVGAALILENAALRIWGPETRRFDTPLPSGTFQVLGVRVTAMHLVVLATATVLALALLLLVQRTAWGRSVRAIRDDIDTARLMGIRVDRIVASVYVIGSVLGVLAGVLFAAYYDSVYVGMGFIGTLNAFTAAVIGGIGSISGSFVGGLVLGLLQTLAIGYISAGYTNAITFTILILLLVLRPYGLLGRAQVSRA
jgi:branched-chain amino acid transport system permease protein